MKHQCTKHIEIDIYFVRDQFATGQVRIFHVPSRYQYADIFTTGLPSAMFDAFQTNLSVLRPSAPTVGFQTNLSVLRPPATTARGY